MTRPRIVVAPHARDLDTVLGRLHASIVYDQYCEKIVAAAGSRSSPGREARTWTISSPLPTESS